MTEPKIAALAPVAVDVEQGKTYYWCSCGLSKKQPFCDGSHSGTEFAPQAYTADESKTVYFCACKRSTKGMFCDGTHMELNK